MCALRYKGQRCTCIFVRETIAKSSKQTITIQHENRVELQKLQVGFNLIQKLFIQPIMLVKRLKAVN